VRRVLSNRCTSTLIRDTLSSHRIRRRTPIGRHHADGGHASEYMLHVGTSGHVQAQPTLLTIPALVI
jgi:hypothetical protein